MRSIVIALFAGICIGAFGVGFTQLGWMIPSYPDRGHRLYGVKNEAAAAATIEALRRSGGPSPKMAFVAGPTNQVVLDDGQRTVIGWFESGAFHLPPNGMSVATSNPHRAANLAAATYRERGFTADVTVVKIGTEALYAVTSNALLYNCIVYRKPWYALGDPTMRPMPRGL